MMVVGPVAGPTEWKFISSSTTPLAGQTDSDGGTADLDEIGLVKCERASRTPCSLALFEPVSATLEGPAVSNALCGAMVIQRRHSGAVSAGHHRPHKVRLRHGNGDARGFHPIELPLDLVQRPAARGGRGVEVKSILKHREVDEKMKKKGPLERAREPRGKPRGRS